MGNLNVEFCACCAFSGDDKFLYAGTGDGIVKMFNLKSSEESIHQLHKKDCCVEHILSSKDSKLLITEGGSFSKLWSVRDFLVMKKKFLDARHLEFSHLMQDKVVGTQYGGIATVYGLHTGQLSRTLKPSKRNGYSGNRATFDPTDSFILSDGVLWDFRAPRQLHCFDKLNQTLTDVFHPNGLEIISNTEVWDTRTFHLLRTVPELDQCQVKFNYGGEVIFAKFDNVEECESETRFLTAFKTLDPSDYSPIATIDTKNIVAGLCSSRNDYYLAVNEESTVRLYEVGRLSTEGGSKR